jgi:hypothetical protein
VIDLERISKDEGRCNDQARRLTIGGESSDDGVGPLVTLLHTSQLSLLSRDICPGSQSQDRESS